MAITNKSSGPFKRTGTVISPRTAADSMTLANQLSWTAGVAVTGGDYSVGRDLDPTNLLHFNVPAGAGMEFSINDVARWSIGSLGALTGTPLLADGAVAGFSVTTTMPAVITAVKKAVDFQITSAGSSGYFTSAVNVDYLAGNTASIGGTAFAASTAVAGTGNNIFNRQANHGLYGASSATTTGTNVGAHGVVAGGNTNIGLVGRAVTDKNGATNIGCAAFGLNAGTTPVQIGGYFGLQNTNPTYASAALMADNGATTSPIAIFRDNGTATVTIGDVGTTHAVAIEAGTLVDGFSSLYLFATLPATITAARYANNFQVTSAGSSAFPGYAMYVALLAGYTGSAASGGLRVSNAAAGTGTAYLSATTFNFGAYITSSATTIGTNAGFVADASGGNINISVLGRSTTAKNSATNVGCAAFGLNTGSSPIQVGGFFGLMATEPTFASAALMADNGAVAADIFVARDNGTAVFTIADGGNVTMTNSLVLAENADVLLDPAMSADGKYNGITRAGTAGAALAFGDLCYLDPTDSKWELTDANAAAAADGDARGVLGICVLAANEDAATKMLLYGIVRADTAFPAMTINAPMYVSETAGDITGTKPTTTDNVVRTVGIALTADELFFNPSSDFITYV